MKYFDALYFNIDYISSIIAYLLDIDCFVLIIIYKSWKTSVASSQGNLHINGSYQDKIFCTDLHRVISENPQKIMCLKKVQTE